MRIRIIAVGKIKESYLREGIDDYFKRLKRYYRLEEIEVKASKKEGPEALKEEARQLERHLEPGSGHFTAILTPEGKQFATGELAQKVEGIFTSGHKSLDMIIGGEEGVPPEIKKQADLLLSLSSLTFPYQLTRLVLAEQLYRCCKIIRGEKYHRH